MSHNFVIEDPCVDIDREELVDDGHRAPTCSRMDLCDNNINGWYRVNKHGKRHPTPSDGIVTRNACVRNETDCCGERVQIRVVNCQSYYAYELKARTTCPERYCFGNVENDIDCIANNGTFGHNSGCHLQTNTVLEVISAFLLLWMCSR
ncbi:uromodulin-like [Mizuhopecten yessoensis]|uniref:uromodulin-like n=1 Tax=Mizuhopecten yessoensis TaxID=6573 RepID=UPI000B45F023|nr:uromodulin-like [Mizuhopecten yessoensis]